MTFSRGRLTSIARGGAAVDYAYDRFGRTLRDGDLTFAYDKNGNRVEIGYPGDVRATVTYDFADRQASLTVEEGAAAPQLVVSAAGYLPSGPLTDLTFGNGAVETRLFDRRYHPRSVAVEGVRSRTRAYQTDAVGNVTTPPWIARSTCTRPSRNIAKRPLHAGGYDQPIATSRYASIKRGYLSPLSRELSYSRRRAASRATRSAGHSLPSIPTLLSAHHPRNPRHAGRSRRDQLSLAQRCKIGSEPAPFLRAPRCRGAASLLLSLPKLPRSR